MNSTEEYEDPHLYNERILNIKRIVKKFNEKFTSIDELDKYIDDENIEKTPKILPLKPSNFDIYQSDLVSHLRSVSQCYDECICNLKCSLEIFSRNKLNFQEDTSELYEVLRHRDALGLSLLICEKEGYIVKAMKVVKDLISKNYYGPELRKTVVELKDVSHELKNKSPESKVSSEYFTFYLYLKDVITTEFNERVIKLIDNGYYDQKINDLFRLALVMDENYAMHLVKIYSESILEDCKKELIGTNKNFIKDGMFSYVRMICDKTSVYLNQGQRYGLNYLPAKRLFFASIVRSLLTVARSHIHDKLDIEHVSNKHYNEIMKSMEYVLKFESNILNITLDDEDELQIPTLHSSYECLCVEIKKGLLSQVLEPHILNCIKQETDKCIGIIKMFRIEDESNKDIKDGVFPLTKKLFSTFNDEMCVVRNANGVWPLLVYSRAIQNVIQLYIRLLSSNLSRTKKIKILCLIAGSAEYARAFLEMVLKITYSSFFISPILKLYLFLLSIRKTQRENIQNALPDFKDLLLFTEEIIALNNIVSTSVKSLSSSLHQNSIEFYTYIIKDYNSKHKEGVNDVSRFIIEFQNALKLIQPTIECYLGPNVSLYWNVHINFLELTIIEFSNTFEKLKPIGEDSCQKLLIDTYYLFDFLKSFPIKHSSDSKELHLFTEYANKCSQYRLDIENVLKIILQLCNGPEIIAELFLQLFPDRNADHLLHIINLGDVPTYERDRILNDFQNISKLS